MNILDSDENLILTPAANKQPLGEVFGFPIVNHSDRAKRYLKDKLCPFNNLVSNCTKNSIDNPLGVCSLIHRDEPVIICPVRFREDWTIVSDAAAFLLTGDDAWTHVGEVKLKDAHGKSAGNIDYVLVSYDSNGRVIDFGSLEVQSVYISGNLTGPFTAYIDAPTDQFTWTQSLKYPKPDYLSSSRKRLIPQIIAKGSILKQWNKKQAVALQRAFFDTLPPMVEVDRSDADFAFFVYDLRLTGQDPQYQLQLETVVYTEFATVLKEIAKFEAGPVETFTESLQEKLDKKRKGEAETVEAETLVVE
jgi:hypothetical protein